MRIELTPKTEELLKIMLPEGGDPSPLIEFAVAELADTGPQEVHSTCIDRATGYPMTREQLRTEIEKGDTDIRAGRVAPLDAKAIKRAGRNRLADKTIR